MNQLAGEIRRTARVADPLLRLAHRVAVYVPEPRSRYAALRLLSKLRCKVHRPGGDERKEVRLPEGIRIVVNVCEAVGADLYYGVGFERTEVEIVKQLIRPGATVFDVGANIGFYTLIAARKIGASGRVHAFEPIPDVYQRLIENVELNGFDNVVANQMAVDETQRDVDLFVNRETALSSLGETSRGEVVSVQKVRATSLDTYVASHRIEAIDFLKVDVEGFEGEVLRGAARLLRRSPELAIMTELAEKNFRPLGRSVDDVIRWMRDIGYDAWEIDRRSGLPLRVSAGSGQRFNQNFVFTRTGSRAEDILSRNR